MVNKEGMDEKKRDPYQITLFRGIPSSSRNGVYNMEFHTEHNLRTSQHKVKGKA